MFPRSLSSTSESLLPQEPLKLLVCNMCENENDHGINSKKSHMNDALPESDSNEFSCKPSYFLFIRLQANYSFDTRTQ